MTDRDNRTSFTFAGYTRATDSNCIGAIMSDSPAGCRRWALGRGYYFERQGFIAPPILAPSLLAKGGASMFCRYFE